MTNAITYSPTTGFWTVTPGLAGFYAVNSSNSGLAASCFATPPNPTGTGVTTTMVGLGNYWSITPRQTGRVKVFITGNMVNGTTADGIIIKIAYGTGLAPLNNASATGTVITNSLSWTAYTGLLSVGVPFYMKSFVQNLTIGTSY
jgi:hypothetical protein